MSNLLMNSLQYTRPIILLNGVVLDKIYHMSRSDICDRGCPIKVIRWFRGHAGISRSSKTHSIGHSRYEQGAAG